jgi:lipopolysaccharide export system permease protein
MGILHRHLFASILVGTVVAVGMFGFVFIAGLGLREYLPLAAKGQLPWMTVVQLIGLMVPYAAVYVLPVGLLTTVLLVLGRMSSQQEITAMRAAGLSLGYISRPIWVIGVGGVLLALALNFQFMPAARTAQRAIRDAALESNLLKLIVPKTFVRDPEDGRKVIYVSERNGSELSDIWLWHLDRQKRVLRVVRARSGTVEFRKDEGVLALTLRDASVETRDEDRPEDFSKPQPVANSDSVTVLWSLDGDVTDTKTSQKLGWQTFGQLMARRQALLEKGSDASAGERRDLTRVTVALNEKAAASFGVLALVFVAVPLGIKVSRKETSANLGLAVLLVLGYYFLAGLVGTLERNPALRPEIWVWVPPLAYVVAGAWLFRRVDRA